MIEAAPVIVLPAADCPALDRTILHDYYFHWDGDPDGEGRGALALGLVTLVQPLEPPARPGRRNYDRRTLDLIAIAPIAPGEEVTIDYGCPLWFEPRDWISSDRSKAARKLGRKLSIPWVRRRLRSGQGPAT